MKNNMKISRRDFLKGTAAAAAMLGFGAAGLRTSASAETAAASAENGFRDLYILYTNDVHCGMDDNIGYVGLMEAKAALQAAGKDVLLADCGDYIQGAVAGTVSKGKYLIDVMNLAGYDVATIGNHEFDYGVDNLFELISEMNFPVVCSNFLDENGDTVLDPYIILEAAGHKIGFVGAVTPTTISTSTPTYFQDEKGNFIYDFCYDEKGEALTEAVQAGIDAAKAAGADLIVILGHIGVDPEQTGSAIYGELQSDKLISRLSGVNLFLDGHSHTVLPSQTVKDKDGKDVVLTQTGTKLKYIGLGIIKADGTVTTQLLDDSGMKALLAEIENDLDEDLKDVVGTSKVDLWINDPDHTDTRLIRTQETNLGDFCADALRVTGNAEIGIVNGGGIRTDLKAGDITYGDLLNVFPFNNSVSVRKVTGSELLDALELSVSQVPAEFGGFLQVSGLSFTFDSSIPTPVVLDKNNMFSSVNGTRRVSDVYVNGEPLEEDREYTVAGISYILAKSGNGYSMFQGEFVLESGAVDAQALATYLKENLNGEIGEDYENPQGDGRIIGG